MINQDNLRIDIKNIVEQYVGEPNDPITRDRIKTDISIYLESLDLYDFTVECGGVLDDLCGVRVNWATKDHIEDKNFVVNSIIVSKNKQE